MGVHSSEAGGVRGLLRSVGRRLVNRPDTHLTWTEQACRTFGDPWLELVLRAGRARDAIADAAGDATEHVNEWHRARLVAAETFDDIWSLAVRGQTLHASATQHRPAKPVARDAAASLHRSLTTIVDEIETCLATTTALELAQLAGDAERVAAQLNDLATNLELKHEVLSSLRSGQLAP